MPQIAIGSCGPASGVSDPIAWGDILLVVIGELERLDVLGRHRVQTLGDGVLGNGDVLR